MWNDLKTMPKRVFDVFLVQSRIIFTNYFLITAQLLVLRKSIYKLMILPTVIYII